MPCAPSTRTSSGIRKPVKSHWPCGQRRPRRQGQPKPPRHRRGRNAGKHEDCSASADAEFTATNQTLPHRRWKQHDIRPLPGCGEGGRAQRAGAAEERPREPFLPQKAIDKSRQIRQPSSSMAEPSDNEMLLDPWLSQFLQHLTSRNSAYTLRNYSRALFEFKRWYQKDRKEGPAFAWDKLNRFDFRTYLHSLGLCKIGRSSTQIRFAALRSFYRYLVQQRLLEYSPIKGLKIPKLPKRLAQFLTVEQMQSLLGAPSGLLPKDGKATRLAKVLCCRDVAVLETIYSCGLRISELCGLKAEDINQSEGLVRVMGKGKKERVVPIGQPALKAINSYWRILPRQPEGKCPVFLASSRGIRAVSSRSLQLRLKSTSSSPVSTKRE